MDLQQYSGLAAEVWWQTQRLRWGGSCRSPGGVDEHLDLCTLPSEEEANTSFLPKENKLSLVPDELWVVPWYPLQDVCQAGDACLHLVSNGRNYRNSWLLHSSGRRNHTSVCTQKVDRVLSSTGAISCKYKWTFLSSNLLSTCIYLSGHVCHLTCVSAVW